MKPCDFGMCFHLPSHRAQCETQGFGHWVEPIYDEDPLEMSGPFQFPSSVDLCGFWCCVPWGFSNLTLGLGEPHLWQVWRNDISVGAFYEIAVLDMAGVLVIKIAGLSSGCGLEKHKAIVCCQGRQRHKMPYVHTPWIFPTLNGKRRIMATSWFTGKTDFLLYYEHISSCFRLLWIWMRCQALCILWESIFCVADPLLQWLFGETIE
jgi:hypothetical protein